MKRQRQTVLRICSGILFGISSVFLLQCGGGVSQSNSSLSCEYPGTWLPIDDYRYEEANASPTALTTDPSGNLFVAGNATVGATQHWIVRKAIVSGGAAAGTHTFLPTPVEDFVYSEGGAASATGIVSDAFGNILVSGFASDATGKTHWLLRKSADGGEHWATADDYLLASGQEARALAITVDANATVFVTGAGASPAHWLLRWATAAGTAWQFPLDNFVSAFGQVSQGNAVVADPFGGVYVAGEATTAKGMQRWMVRRSSPTSATVVSDDYLYPGGTGSAATGVASDGKGTIYSVGWGTYGSSRSHWIVRKAVRAATSPMVWQTVDDFYYPGSTFASPSGVAVDPSGSVAVTGTGTDLRGVGRWITRRSLDGGKYWQTLDDYLPTNGTGAEGNAITTDRFGNLYVAGYTLQDVTTHWQVRKLLCR